MLNTVFLCYILSGALVEFPGTREEIRISSTEPQKISLGGDAKVGLWSMPLFIWVFVLAQLSVVYAVVKARSKTGSGAMFKRYMDASRRLYGQWEQNITRRFLLRIAGAEYAAVAGMHDHIDRERAAEWDYIVMVDTMINVAKWSTSLVFCLVVAAAPLLAELELITGVMIIQIAYKFDAIAVSCTTALRDCEKLEDGIAEVREFAKLFNMPTDMEDRLRMERLKIEWLQRRLRAADATRAPATGHLEVDRGCLNVFFVEDLAHEDHSMAAADALFVDDPARLRRGVSFKAVGKALARAASNVKATASKVSPYKVPPRGDASPGGSAPADDDDDGGADAPSPEDLRSTMRTEASRVRVSSTMGEVRLEGIIWVTFSRTALPSQISLMRIIAGMVIPSGGFVYLPPFATAQFVPDHAELIPGTIAENLRWACGSADASGLSDDALFAFARALGLSDELCDAGRDFRLIGAGVELFEHDAGVISLFRCARASGEGGGASGTRLRPPRPPLHVFAHRYTSSLSERSGPCRRCPTRSCSAPS